MTELEKRKAIDLALLAMDKQFGRGTVLRLGSDNAVPVEAISSGCLSIDVALGVGGFPRGRVAGGYGPGAAAFREAASPRFMARSRQGRPRSRCR